MYPCPGVRSTGPVGVARNDCHIGVERHRPFSYDVRTPPGNIDGIGFDQSRAALNAPRAGEGSLHYFSSMHGRSPFRERIIVRSEKGKRNERWEGTKN